MFRKFNKKRLAVLAGVTTLALAAIAFAFFSSTGGGSGTGSVSNPTTTNALTVTGTVTTALYPGGSSPVTFTVDNALGQAVQLDEVHLVSITPDGPHSTCVTTVAPTASPVFSMSNVNEDQLIPANANDVALTNGGTLNMADSGVSQDNCKGATLTLTLSSN